MLSMRARYAATSAHAAPRRALAPTSSERVRSGPRSGLKPPAPLGRLASSVVVGVWNEVATFPYTASHGAADTFTPSVGLHACRRRAPESSGSFLFKDTATTE